MDEKPSSTIGARTTRRTAPVRPGDAATALLLGTAAATVGVAAPGLDAIGGITPIIVALALLVAVVSRGRAGTVAFRMTIFDVCFIGFVALILALELIDAETLHHSPSLWQTVFFLTGYLATIATRIVIRRSGSIRFLELVAAPALVVSVIGVLQVLRVPGVNEILSTTTKAVGFTDRLEAGWQIRATSLIGHWTALGGYCCAAIAILGSVAVLRKRTGRPVGLTIVALVVVALGLFSTLTFAVIAVGVAVIVMTFFALRMHGRLILGIGVIGVIAFFLFGNEFTVRVAAQTGPSQYRAADLPWWVPQTVGYRVGVWNAETIPAIVQRPLTGWGAQVYTGMDHDWPITARSLVWSSPESEYFRLLIQSGWLGLIGELLLVAVAIGLTMRYSGATSLWSRPVLLTFFAGLLIISGVHSHLSNPGAPLLLWVLVAAVISRSDPWGHVPPAAGSNARQARREMALAR